MSAIETNLSQISNGEIAWRLNMIQSLLEDSDGNQQLEGHCTLLLKEMEAYSAVGPIAVLQFAGLFIPGEPGGVVYKIHSDVPVGPATAYTQRAFHMGDQT